MENPHSQSRITKPARQPSGIIALLEGVDCNKMGRKTLVIHLKAVNLQAFWKC